MADEEDEDDQPVYEDDEPENGIFRWMSAVVVILAVAGFFGLAWYAYRNGGDTVDEKDVELVKADKAPVKEAPVNPGGMQIPNQDKTVYGLISGKTEKPVVEHILPAPEEPMPRTGGDTETWMSDSLKGKTGSEGDAGTATPVDKTTEPASGAADKTPAPKEQFNPASVRNKPAEQAPVVASATPPVTAPVVKAPASDLPPIPPVASAPPAPVKPVKPPAPETKPAAEDSADSDDNEEKPPEKKPAPPPAPVPAAGIRVQLGAYKSQGEAENNWKKIAGNFSDDIQGKQHYVVRADLGGKGVFYRLQLAPFGSSRDAEEFCIDFVSAGQNCIVAKGK